MNIIQALILGIVQGATEFLPLSSSGHLVLVPWLLRWPSPGLPFDVLVHWGTLAAVLLYFRQDLGRLAWAWVKSIRERHSPHDPYQRLAWLILLGTLPAALLGFLLEDFFRVLFEAPRWAAIFLLCTGIILVLTEQLGRQTDPLDKLTWPGVILIGLAQALAIAPGISRSGATIGAGLLVGLTREAAARFSFLLSVPIILGAGLLQIIHLFKTGTQGQGVELLIGFIAAALSGYLCIHTLLQYVRHNSLRIFALYCWIVGFLSLSLSFRS